MPAISGLRKTFTFTFACFARHKAKSGSVSVVSSVSRLLKIYACKSVCVRADGGKAAKGVTANTQQDTDKMVDNNGNFVALNPRKRINFKLIEKEVNNLPTSVKRADEHV